MSGDSSDLEEMFARVQERADAMATHVTASLRRASGVAGGIAPVGTPLNMSTGDVGKLFGIDLSPTGTQITGLRSKAAEAGRAVSESFRGGMDMNALARGAKAGQMDMGLLSKSS